MCCSACKGPYSETNGHRFTERMQICGTCATSFVKWIVRHTSRRWGKLRFYDYTTREVRHLRLLESSAPRLPTVVGGSVTR